MITTYSSQNRCRHCNERLQDGPVFSTEEHVLYHLDCARKLFPDEIDEAKVDALQGSRETS